MANLSVRKLDEEVFSKLRMRAAAHGVLMEEEVRQILKQAVTNPIKLGDMQRMLKRQPYSTARMLISARRGMRLNRKQVRWFRPGITR